jgi:hypothetical protein
MGNKSLQSANLVAYNRTPAFLYGKAGVVIDKHQKTLVGGNK